MRKYKRKKGQNLSKAKKHIFNGVEYKSFLEAYMAQILTKEGLFFQYEPVKFNLQEPFNKGGEYWERQTNGKGEFKLRNSSIRGISYIPDFIGEGFIIETKGYANESFPIKYKMFKHLISDSDYTLYKPQNKKECDETLNQILKKEAWKLIPNYLNYEISNYGRVRRVEKVTKISKGRKGFVKEKVLKQTVNSSGYKVLHLSNKKGKKFHQVHRLCMLSFYPDEESETVNHIDENKLNNGLSNLEWMTKSENIKYSKNKSVIKLSEDGEVIKEYESLKDTFSDGHSPICVSKCCKGLQEKSGGYKWKFKNS